MAASWSRCVRSLARLRRLAPPSGRPPHRRPPRQRLRNRRPRQRRARAHPQASPAPTPVLETINTLSADLEAARVRLQAQRAVTLVLQDRVAEQVKRCQEALAQIARLRQGALAQTFVRSAPAVWS